MGGWPPVCGWVDNVVPKVCCEHPLVLGGALMRKIEDEKERHSYCGRAVWAPKLSQTELDFKRLLKILPEVDTSDPSRFDPPLEKKPEIHGGAAGYNGSSGGYGGNAGGIFYSMQFQFPWMLNPCLVHRTELGTRQSGSDKRFLL
ncbi:hypothetical protein AVEN_222261-1 [Araneus ventricosus]|uniref:Uncharacterized protein n=1 Tax=Araneus ventricosus TaxID=182803 RepID=A0A4Y2L9W7_ARAVE|nr:hypothetical protein AVEN_222261-1 [Araneus ventricosus]